MERSDPFDITLLLAAILHRAAKWVRTDHGYICLVNPHIGRLEVVYGIGVGTPYDDATLARGEGLGGKVWETGEIKVVSDYGQWEGRVSDLRTRYHGIAFASLGVPIRTDEEVVGVIGLFYTDAGREFTDEEIAFFARMGEIAGTVIQQARQVRDREIASHIDAFHESVPAPPAAEPGDEQTS